jgi:hypothetical protein
VAVVCEEDGIGEDLVVVGVDGLVPVVDGSILVGRAGDDLVSDSCS